MYVASLVNPFSLAIQSPTARWTIGGIGSIAIVAFALSKIHVADRYRSIIKLNKTVDKAHMYIKALTYVPSSLTFFSLMLASLTENTPDRVTYLKIALISLVQSVIQLGTSFFHLALLRETKAILATITVFDGFQGINVGLKGFFSPKSAHRDVDQLIATLTHTRLRVYDTQPTLWNYAKAHFFLVKETIACVREVMKVYHLHQALHSEMKNHPAHVRQEMRSHVKKMIHNSLSSQTSTAL